MKKSFFKNRTAAMLLAASLLCLSILPGASTSTLAASGGDFVLSLRDRSEKSDDGEFRVVYREEKWKPSETAIIVCDMWDKHWCKGATRRVAEMAPCMNETVAKARDMGAFIIHAPSSTMETYKDHPARKRAQNAPQAPNPPEDIGKWRHWLDETEKADYPVDQSDGGCDCEPKCKSGKAWSSQIADIKIENQDAITDSGVETWNLLEARGIKNVMLLGVHTNMCVLGRPFGLRNMARNGKNVVLVRDLTDTMYNSRARPCVNHFVGNDLIADHIEKYVCPTVTSAAITGNAPFRFKEDTRPRVVFLIAEGEYGARETQPQFERLLQNEYGLHAECLVNVFEGTKGLGLDRNSLPNPATIQNADLLVVFMRRRAVSARTMGLIRAHLDAGKPLVGIRTASHAFNAKVPVPSGETTVKDGKEVPVYLAQWVTFDPEVLGGNYSGHHGNRPGGTATQVVPGMAKHPILKGVDMTGFVSMGSLYKCNPLSPRAWVLMTGSIPGEEPEPVLWTHSYKGARIVATSLGHPADYNVEAFRSLMVNAFFWALDRRVEKLDKRDTP